MTSHFLCRLATLAMSLFFAWAARAVDGPPPVLVTAPSASYPERLAALELRRYIYLRTGRMPVPAAELGSTGDALVIASKSSPLLAGLADRATWETIQALPPQEYLLKTTARNGGRVLLVAGGDPVGTLYGAYRLIERLGVRFYLHGDVVPDERIPWTMPQVEEHGRPLFAVRGIQPFHDFPEGPDWWNTDDYLATITQLAKLRMNFIGLHCYPEGGVGPEPAVWIGQPADTGTNGVVTFSYPSQWASTARSNLWGYAPLPTAEFAGGADRLFETNDFGPAVMNKLLPCPATAAQANQLFNKTAEMFRAAFTHARALGVKTCIGTETPLKIPKAVCDRLTAQGRDPKDPAVVREIYEGLFRRIASSQPLDYYWQWTPEDWTWRSNTSAQTQATIQDIRLALDALKAAGDPFTLATCGWVLGPVQDRAALDAVLPGNCPMSCFNREVGHEAIEPGFEKILGRPKWAIPWLENDPNLVAPQPWVGRMRYDAVDARRLGCTGLLGIHWRTKIMGPNVAALAAAGWDQSWSPKDFQPLPPVAKGAGKIIRGKDRSLPADDFQLDFARVNFGDAVAGPVGKLFSQIDGVRLPEPSGWEKGPGGIKIDARPWDEVKAHYAFVEELAALRPQIQGAGNRERFDYWLNTYRAMAAMAQVGCRRGQLDQFVKQINQEKGAARQTELARQALTVRLQMARDWERLLAWQVAATDTPGELGTLANLEQHTRRTLKFLEAHDGLLSKILGAPLPAGAAPGHSYTGEPRIIVPTVRTVASLGETLRIKVIILDNAPVKNALIHCRVLGHGEYLEMPLRHLGRAVYAAVLPSVQEEIEYYFTAETASGKHLVWPATAPVLNQTVMVTE